MPALPALRRGLAAALVAALALIFPCHGAANWPAMRGPSFDGWVEPAGAPPSLPLHWSEHENIRWKTEIPDRGWSTPVIMDGRVWLTTATEDGHDFFAISVDAGTGKILVNKKLFHAENPEPLGNNVNSYATPSPVIEPGRVYVHFGSYGTACLDAASGAVLWQRTNLPCRHYRGPSSSPVLFGNFLIITMDGVDLQYTTALNKLTGETVWKTNRSVAFNDENVPGERAKLGDLRKAHSTPIVVTNNGRPVLLSAGAKAIYAYDPLTGAELWKVRHLDYSAAPGPIFDHGTAWFVSGLSKTELLSVKVDGKGDITDTGVNWRRSTHIGKYSSPVLVDGLIYTAAAESFLTCLDAASGDPVWTERIGGAYEASALVDGGRIYFCNVDGVTTVIKAGRTCDVLATNTLDDGLMASPAAAGHSLYLRTKTHLYRIEEKGVAAADGAPARN